MTDPAPIETTLAPSSDPPCAQLEWVATGAERSSAAPSEAGAPDAVDASELCHAVVRAVTLSPTSGDALDALFGVLRLGCGALALALEVAAGSATRLQPYGDIRALMEASAEGADP